MFDYENKYKDLGLVAGIDEAGRGPLAGPVVCACVIMPLDKDKIIDGINDSKKLSAKKREILFDQIVEKATDYSVVEIDPKIIDAINILNATKLGMKKALDGLKTRPNVVLVDAVKIDKLKDLEYFLKKDLKGPLLVEIKVDKENIPLPY